MTHDANPDLAYEHLIQQARVAIRANRFTGADRLAREALAHDPERAAAYNLLAAIHELEGEHPEAMNLLRAGLAVEPDYAPAQDNLKRLAQYPRRGGIRLGDEEE